MLNYLFNNDLVFYSMFAGTVGFIGYKFASSYVNSFYVDKSIQTDAWEDYSERLSQIGSNSVTSIDTVTPISQYVSPTSEVGIQTISDGASSVTTVLPIPSVNVEMIPNPDITLVTKELVNQGVQTITNPMFNKDWTTIIEYINNKPSFFSILQVVILE